MTAYRGPAFGAGSDRLCTNITPGPLSGGLTNVRISCSAQNGPLGNLADFIVLSQSNRDLIREISNCDGHGSDGLLLDEADDSWCLSDARWPIHPSAPCRLRFDTPLRLIRHGNLIYTPPLADFTVAAQRRLRPFLTEPTKSNFDKMGPTLLAFAHAIPASPWRGERHDLR